MFQTPPPGRHLRDFIKEVNTFLVPSRDLWCAEYCFQCDVNPYQHPRLDRNIHHLLAVAAALSNSCGGVIFLNVQETIPRTETSILEAFRTRLMSTLGNSGIEKLEVLVITACDNASGLVAIKRTDSKVAFTTAAIERSELYMNVKGQIHARNSQLNCTTEQEMDVETVDVSPNPRDSFNIPDECTDVEESSSNGEFAALHKLDWANNKRNWRSILNRNDQSSCDIIKSCDIWQPTKPMHVTPDKQSLIHLFSSEKELTQLLEHVDPGCASFAIVHRSWISLLPIQVNIPQPGAHICDILTVSEQSEVCLWVIIKDTSEFVIWEQVEYMFTLGRMMKHQLCEHSLHCPSISISCRLHSPVSHVNVLIGNFMQGQEVNSVANQIATVFQESGKFEYIQLSIATLLLTKNTNITNCIGDEISLKLSQKQAAGLIKGTKVNYISGPPGSGKTICALYLYRKYGKNNSVYVCTTRPFLNYLKFNGCGGTLIGSDDDLNRHCENGTFRDKECVILDDGHNLVCSRESMQKLFILLRQKRDMCLFVFADNKYQSFNTERQRNLQDLIFDLTRQTFGEYPRSEYLTEIYRNTRKVVSFIQHAIEDIEPGCCSTVCENTMDGEGIECIAMGNIWTQGPDNELVHYLKSLLFPEDHQKCPRYMVTDVAVLLDVDYTEIHLNLCREILQSQFPEIAVQTSGDFPRVGIVVDTADSFVGLDASVCVFILLSNSQTDSENIYSSTSTPTQYDPGRRQSVSDIQSESTLNNPRYRVYLASRATHKAVFIVPEIDANLIQTMKFDRFQVEYKTTNEFLIFRNTFQISLATYLTYCVIGSVWVLPTHFCVKTHDKSSPDLRG